MAFELIVVFEIKIHQTDFLIVWVPSSNTPESLPLTPDVAGIFIGLLFGRSEAIDFWLVPEGLEDLMVGGNFLRKFTDSP